LNKQKTTKKQPLPFQARITCPYFACYLLFSGQTGDKPRQEWRPRRNRTYRVKLEPMFNIIIKMKSNAIQRKLTKM